MEKKQQIYCIEGVHNWGEGEIEPSVEPMLELLKKTGYWDYTYRTCATLAELKFRLEEEWNKYCDKGSLLYFCTHGAPDQIRLSDEPSKELESLTSMKEYVRCSGRYVHFGGCDTFSKGDANLKTFLEETNAAAVSGYAKDVFWIDWPAPALALELQLFARLWSVRFSNRRKERAKELSAVGRVIKRKFPHCEFNMLTRPYNQK